jgi:hypothetical protein
VGLPWGLELGEFPLREAWAIEPRSVALVVARAVGVLVGTSFHPVISWLQVLAGIMVDVV